MGSNRTPLLARMTTIVMGTDVRELIRHRVKRCIALLDADTSAELYEWYNKVDLTNFDMSDTSHDLFGQLFGNSSLDAYGLFKGLQYFARVDRAGTKLEKVVPRDMNWAVEHALVLDQELNAWMPDYTEQQQWKDLTAVWAEEIHNIRISRTGGHMSAIMYGEGDEEE